MGDRYPVEEALRAAKERANNGDWDVRNAAAQFDEDDEDGPGGRLHAQGQEDQESRILDKIKVS